MSVFKVIQRLIPLLLAFTDATGNSYVATVKHSKERENKKGRDRGHARYDSDAKQRRA